MRVDVEINVYDAVNLLRNAIAAKIGVPVGGITITSWEQVVLQVQGETVVHPVRHHLNPSHGSSVFQKKT